MGMLAVFMRRGNCSVPSQLRGVFLYAALLFYRRRKLKKMVAGMEKRKVDGTVVIYVTKTPVTPSTVGVFRPKIVMPEAILKGDAGKEFQTILLHEKTHIRLGIYGFMFCGIYYGLYYGSILFLP